MVVDLHTKGLRGRGLHTRLQVIRNSRHRCVGGLAHAAFGSPHDIRQAVIPNRV